MKLDKITNAISKSTGRAGLVVKKYSPEILMGVGIVSAVGGTVLACRATLKCEDVLVETKEKLAKVKEAKEICNEEDYSEADYKKDLTIVYAQTGVEFAKLYLPALTMGALSITCMLSAHGIMKKRNAALVAAYTVVEQSFADYRKRVVEELGEEKDKQFKFGTNKETLVVEEIDEKGKVKNKKVEVVTGGEASMYARFFDEASTQWTKTPEYNLTFLKCQQNYANDLLKSRGHLFLNEVYDMLGIDRSQAGSIVGWVLGEGDDFVDFGIYNGESDACRAFVNGYERSILLDFNVDGVIYDLI